MKNKLLTGWTWTGKTYTFFREYAPWKRFLALSPCRQLSYESFIKYWDKEKHSLINGEVHYTPTDSTSTFAVYENANVDTISDYDIIFIDEFHFITDTDRGDHLLEVIEKANELGITVIGATATNNVDDEDLASLQFEVIELQPFFEKPNIVEIEDDAFIENASKGMSSIVFVRYTPNECDMAERVEKTWLEEDQIAIISAATRPAKRLQAQLAFERGDITLILSTNVLAQGLNFPAQQVMIYYNPYDGWEIINQKLGRLGRFGYGISEAYFCGVAEKKIYKKQVEKRTYSRNGTYCPYISMNIDKEFPMFMLDFYLGYYNWYKYSRWVLEYLYANKKKYLNNKQEDEVCLALQDLRAEEEKILIILGLHEKGGL